MKNGFYLDYPAADWEKGLPVGCGRLGAVIFGGGACDRVLLNEESLWYGAKKERFSPAGAEKLQAVRALFEEGRAEEAQKLCTRWFGANPRYSNAYQPAADVRIEYFVEKQPETG